MFFFVSTAGDNMIHKIPTCPTLTDIQQISPNLPACTPVSAGGNDLGCTFTGKNRLYVRSGYGHRRQAALDHLTAGDMHLKRTGHTPVLFS